MVLCVALGLGAHGAAAQPRRPARPACALTTVTLSGFVGDALDPSTAPAVVPVRDGALSVWRDRAGALWVRAWDAQWRPVLGAREVARPAGAFAVVPTATGAAVVYVEGGHDVLVARVGARGEAQNVPRRVMRETETVDDVALARVESGLAVLWSAARGRVMRGIILDDRAVPRAPAVELGPGRAPRLAWSPSTASLTVTALGAQPTEEPTLMGLSPTMQVNSRLRWPASTLGPFDLGGALYGVQVHGTGTPVLARVPPGGATMGSPGEPAARARVTVLDAVIEGASALVALYEEAASRTTLARLTPEGAQTPTVLREGPAVPLSLAVRGDGTLLVARREPVAHNGSRLVVTVAACER